MEKRGSFAGPLRATVLLCMLLLSITNVVTHALDRDILACCRRWIKQFPVTGSMLFLSNNDHLVHLFIRFNKRPPSSSYSLNAPDNWLWPDSRTGAPTTKTLQLAFVTVASFLCPSGATSLASPMSTEHEQLEPLPPDARAFASALPSVRGLVPTAAAAALIHIGLVDSTISEHRKMPSTTQAVAPSGAQEAS